MKKRKLFAVCIVSCALFGNIFGMRRKLTQNFKKNLQKRNENENERHRKLLLEADAVLGEMKEVRRQHLGCFSKWEKEIQEFTSRKIISKRKTQVVDANMLCTFAVFISALMLSLLF